MTTQATIKIGGEDMPLDAADADTVFVDVFTERAVTEGIIRLGLGHIIAAGDKATWIKSDVHLRMSPSMAARTIEVLKALIEKTGPKVVAQKVVKAVKPGSRPGRSTAN